MGEYLCSYLEEPAELGCGSLQLFDGVISNETSKVITSDIHFEEPLHWKNDDSYDLIYELPKNIDESNLPNRKLHSKQTMDTHSSKSLENWVSADILQWICDECTKNNRDYELLPLHKLRAITMNQFRNMPLHDFLNVFENKGDAEFLFNCKERLLASRLNKKLKRVEEWIDSDIMEWICDVFEENNRDYERVPLKNFKNITINEFKMIHFEQLNRLLGSWDDAELVFNCKNALFACSTSFSNQTFHVPRQEEVNNNSNVHDIDAAATFTNLNAKSEPVGIRKRGRPRKKETQRAKNEPRTGKLWEFIRNLLMDKRTCPSLIKWENYEMGEFKFVQNEKVAKLWGHRKNNEKMNYEKFSRAMRYYYQNDILQPVSGKRLVYKFGPNATGWRDVEPIL